MYLLVKSKCWACNLYLLDIASLNSCPMEKRVSPFLESLSWLQLKIIAEKWDVAYPGFTVKPAETYFNCEQFHCYDCCCCSLAKLCQTLCECMHCSMPDFQVLHYLPECAQTHVHWLGDAIWQSRHLSSPYPFALNLSQHQGLFQGISFLNQVTKVLRFNLSTSPSNEYSGLISFRIDWFDLLAVQVTLKSLL